MSEQKRPFRTYKLIAQHVCLNPHLPFRRVTAYAQRMRVAATFRKRARRGLLERVDALHVIGGRGIVGDVSANPASPRQILLTSEAVYRELRLAPEDLRANLIVSGAVETWRSGQLIRIGRSVVIRLTYPCEACFRLNDVRPTLARAVNGRRGMLGRVLTDGMIEAHDPIEILPSVLPAIPTAPRDRLYAFVCRIPRGHVASFLDAVRTLGFPKTYARIMPRFLREAENALPVHRMISESGRLISQHLPAQHERLLAEGVPVTDAVVARSCRWNVHEFFADEWLSGYYPAISV